MVLNLSKSFHDKLAIKKTLVFFIGFFAVLNCYSQENRISYKTEVLTKQAKKANLSKAQIKDLKELIVNHENLIEISKGNWSKQDSVSIIYYWDKRVTVQDAERVLNEGVTKIVTKEQFKKMFDAQLTDMAQVGVAQHLMKATNVYKLNDNQKDKLKKELFKGYYKEAFARTYYKHDPNLSYKKTKEAELRISENYEKTLVELGLDPTTYKLEKSERIDAFTAKAKLIGIADNVVYKIKELVAVRDQKLEQYSAQWAKMMSSSIVEFYDEKESKQSINKEFKKQLAALLTKSQYGAIFKEFFEYRAQRDTDEKMEYLKKAYNPTSDHQKTLAKVVYDNSLNEIVTEEYYSYNGSLIHIKRKETKLHSIATLRKVLKAQGYSYKGEASDFKKINNFITKATKAGVEKENIDLIIDTYSKNQEAAEQASMAWSKNNEENILEFYFEEFNKNSIEKKFRNNLPKYITEDQFLEIFKNDFIPYVEYLAAKEFKNIKNTYDLTAAQQNEIKQLLDDRFLKEVMYFQYYQYNYPIRDKKTSGVKYEFSKVYREKMKSYGF